MKLGKKKMKKKGFRKIVGKTNRKRWKERKTKNDVRYIYKEKQNDKTVAQRCEKLD